MSVFAINEDSLKIEKLNRQVTTLESDIYQLDGKVSMLKSQVKTLNEHKKNVVDTINKTYTASLTTLQGILTFVFGFGSLLSVGIAIWGFKGIYKTKQDIKTDLNTLKEKKKKFDTEYDDFKEKTKSITDRITRVEESNLRLDRKVTILNLLEKIIEAHDKKDFKLALTYLDTALLVDDETEMLLNYKLKSLKALYRYDETIDIYYKLLNCAYEELDYLFQLCEVLLCESKIEEYEKLVSSYSEKFQEIDEYEVTPSSGNKDIYVYYLYIKAMYCYIKDDEKELFSIYEKLKKIEWKDNAFQAEHSNPFYPKNKLLLSELIKLDKFDDMNDELRNTMKDFIDLLISEKV